MKFTGKKWMLVLLLGCFLCFFPGAEKEPVMAASYSFSNQTIVVQAANGEDLQPVMAQITQYLKGQGNSGVYTVQIPAGEYKLSGAIHVYGNIRLECKGATIEYTGKSGNMIVLGDTATNTDPAYSKGYGTRGNITISGGKWIGNDSNTSSLIRMAHAFNVTMEDCIISGGKCAHQVEVAAIDGFYVRSCIFENMAIKDKSENKEALQLDMPCSTTAFKGTLLDGTPMKNVEIRGCVFRNLPRGVGTHSMVIGNYHTNIRIQDNFFENIAGECVVALNYKKCQITGNTMKNCGAGVLFQYFKPDVLAVYNTIYDGTVSATGTLEHDSESEISNNIMSIVDTSSKYVAENSGIIIYGYELPDTTKATGVGSSDIIPAMDYYVGNVKIQENEITTSEGGIHLSDAHDSTVSGNHIVNTDENSNCDGILVDAGCQNIDVSENEIKDVTGHGISVDNFSTLTNISDNEITNTMFCGINLHDNSKVLGNIERNVIDDSQDNAINLETECSAANITDNTITSSQWHGINLLDGCNVTGKISGNDISKSAKNGIFLNLYSSAKNITENMLTQNGSYAIALYDNSNVSGNIASNTIKKNKKHAIQLNLNCVASKISNNKITTTSGKAICVLQDSSILNTISGNVIQKATQEGIYINASQKSFSIKSNRISNCGRNPILINTSCKKQITIQKNKLTPKKGVKALWVLKGNGKSDIKTKK